MQLLRIMPAFDPDIIDMFLLFRETQLAQHVASDNEVFSMLCLLIQRLDQFSLVVDGIDECQDQMQFWTRLQSVCGGPASTSVALFSRPTVTIPAHMAPTTNVLALNDALNLDDIQTFLRPRVMAMVDSGLIRQSDIQRNCDDTVNQIARRANGMFLWATLFMEYLQSPHISVRGRHEALNDLNRLEGLDLLYGAILRTLVQRPGSARANTLQAFELVLYSIRPLHVTELQHAVAVPMDRALDQDDLIPDFHRNLGHLSGALMELDKNGFVRFIHLSIIEFLTDGRSAVSQPDVPPEVAMDRTTSHASLACRCLSYLYFSVKAEPLAGASRTVPDAASQVKRYPLLDYAAEFWSFHVLECMEALESSPVAGQRVEVMVRLASRFLSSKHSVMAWIEASWMFKRPPQIRQGPKDQFFIENPPVPLHIGAQLKSAWEAARSALLRLAHDLATINTSWGHVLGEEPNEIWEPSISAFHQSPFWQRVSGARITAQFETRPDDDYHSICLRTRLSPDGRHLGLVRLYISREDSTQFSLFFERWSIHPNAKLHEVNLNIPRSCLKPFLSPVDEQPAGTGSVPEFQCPVALTADLRRVVAPGCVVHIPEMGGEQPQADLDDTTQFIDFTGNAWRHGPFRFRIEDFELRYDIQMSDTGQYLMTVQKSNGLVDVQKNMGCHLRLITVYEDANWGKSSRPSYRHVSSLAFKPNYLPPSGELFIREGDGRGDWCALIHPQYPIVAIQFQRFIICGHGRVFGRGGNGAGSALWNFKDPTSGMALTNPLSRAKIFED